MDSIVALDIETTGLDPEKDAIIEIGAVRFKNRRVEGEWSTLINPGKPIPPFITNLTNITDQMVVKAPMIDDVLDDLARFVGKSPVLNHNVRFDISFFKRFRLFRLNETIDTYELASVLLPGASRYNLGALAQDLGIPYMAKHRGLDDAYTAMGVYLRLYEEVQALPTPLLAEIVRLGEQVEWGANWTLREVLRARGHEVISSDKLRLANQSPIYTKIAAHLPAPLQAIGEPVALDPEEVTALIDQGGVFSKHFPHFEYRSQQVEMLRAVTEALSKGRHLLVEAGTGTGKSMAYLIPAALWATQNNRRVVISTNTINLQDQLINKDIPDLRAALGLDVRSTILKGRGNYLCPRRLEILRKRGPESSDEARVLGKVLVWMQATHTGDRGEINLNGPSERQVWSRLSAEDEGCTAENCLKITGGACPFYRVRQSAQSAHLIIVNHALLLADVATGNRVLPDYEYLIIDEAHHLENATTNALSFHATQWDVTRLLKALGGPSNGALGRLLEAAQSIIDPSEYGALSYMINRITDLVFQLDHQIELFFEAIDQFLLSQREGKEIGAYSHQERIVSATRAQPAWGEVELTWDDTYRTLMILVEIFGKLNQGVAEINDALVEVDEDLYNELFNLYRRLSEFAEKVNALVLKPANDQIYWAEIQPSGGRVSLHAAPLHIGALMEQYLWREKSSVILTSATLTAAGEFDYLRGRLNAQDAYELALGSPFDYESSALLYLVNDISEPSDRGGHQRAVEKGLIDLCKTIGGRTLVLFTSYDQLKRTGRAITSILAKHEVIVYEQGDGASPHTLLENFRNAERAVLLGTRAFWEGVDLPGEALTTLVIAKLPFDVPSDPIVAARAETFEDSFSQYSLPEAILRFRQGFGRLIRTQFDRGVVVIFDRRVLTKRYGRLFIDSLPTCTTRVDSLANLPRSAQQWLNQ